MTSTSCDEPEVRAVSWAEGSCGPVDGVALGRALAASAAQPVSLSRRLARGVKVAFDVLAAALLLVVMAPMLLLVVLLIQVESPGTPFYRARRVGYRGRPLDVLKFRKMHLNARGLPLTVAGDARLTRVGALMARTRIDELPQLWNVVRGQMSLVGPRPEDARFVALHADEYRRILGVRPGITGWSQLAYAGESRLLDQADPVGHYIARILPAKIQMDTMYAERPRLIADLATLLWTALAMLLDVEVAVHRRSGRMSRRRPRLSRLSRDTARVAHDAPRAQDARHRQFAET